MRRPGLRARCAVSVLLCMLAAVTLRADVFQWNGGNFMFAIDHMPDFDQRRTAGFGVVGIPNGGKMYCVPTAAMDLLAFIATHGFPAVAPGPTNWTPPESNATYNSIGLHIILLGAFMGTDAVTGTQAPLQQPATQGWLDATSPGMFNVVHILPDQNVVPRIEDVSIWSFFGAVVDLGFGAYTNAGTAMPHVHDGGHMTTLVGASRLTDAQGSISFNDPWDSPNNDNNLFTQSDFGAKMLGWEAETASFCGNDGNGNPTKCFTRTQDHIGSGRAYLDAFLAIMPKYAFSYDIDSLYMLKPIQFSSHPERVTQRFAPADGGHPIDAAMNPVKPLHAYLTEGSDAVWQLDPLTGESRALARLPEPASRLVYGGPHGDLYVLTPRRIERLDREGRSIGSLPLPLMVDAIAYDDRNQRLVGAVRDLNLLVFLDPGLTMQGFTVLPTGALGRAGRLTLSVSPRSGEVFALTEHSLFVAGIVPRMNAAAAVRDIPIPADAADPTGLSVDNRDVLYVTSQGAVFPMDSRGMLLRASRFFGIGAGSGIVVSRPFSNFDPRFHVGPEWRNVDPEAAQLGLQ